MRRTLAACGGFTMKYKQGTGLWDEDHVNDYKANRYLSARSTMRWYAEAERLRTRQTLNARRATQSAEHNAGRHHSGRGAFEREAERRGIAVEKYPLTSTTGARRAAELVLLRRAEMERRAAGEMERQRREKKRAEPSEWYDEAKGPLNPAFLRRMRAHYEVDIDELPNTPVAAAGKA